MNQPTPSTAAALPPLRMNVTVPLAPAEAFDLFTREIAAWWPLATHSVCGAEAATCGFEDGALVETGRDGSRHVWGRVIAWEPPSRVALTWHPGREEASGQELELRFVAAGGHCRVELEHTGWERLGAAAEATRSGYEGGWQHVVGTLFRQAAEARGNSGGGTLQRSGRRERMGRPVVHWELWSKDPQRTGEFYAKVFDWQVQAFPQLSYHMVDTGGQGINGGIMKPQDGPWPGNMAFYVDVEDLAAALAKIVAAGGKTIVERQEVPGMGAIALFEDPDGRVMGLWQTAK